jgi:hypothetical protein
MSNLGNHDPFGDYLNKPTLSGKQQTFTEGGPVSQRLSVMKLIAEREAQRYTSGLSAYRDRGYDEEEEPTISIDGFLGNHKVRFDLEPQGYLYDVRCFEGNQELIKYQIDTNKCLVCLSETEIYEVTLFPARESFEARSLEYGEVLAKLEI